MRRLAALRSWQLALLLLALGVAAAFTISYTIRLLSSLNSAISAIGGLVIVGWAYLAIQRRREKDEWLDS